MTWHAMERAWERLGVELTPSDLTSLIRQVHAGAALLQADKGHSQIWLVRHPATGVYLSAVLSVDRSAVMTVLRPDELAPPLAMPMRGRRRVRRERSRLRREIEELSR